MARLLRFALLAGAVAAVWAPAAGAARNLALPDSVTSSHFQVHFSGAADNPWRINVMQANDIAAWAERAYAAYVSWGYTAPLDDGDGRSDFYVEEMPEGTWGGAASDNPTALTSSAYATVNAQVGIDERKIAHLVFHFFQAAGWNPLDSWLREAGAEWAAFRLLGFPLTHYSDEADEDVPITDSFARTAIPVDCAGEQCGDTIYEQGNYQAWPFFAYLGERYGTQVVKDVHDRGPVIGDPNAPALDFLEQVLTTKGAQLADVFNDWTVAAMSGNYVAPGLKGTKPQTWTTLATGITAGQIATIKVPVNHLSVRYVGVQRAGRAQGPATQRH